MKYVDEFRSPAATEKLLARIERDAKKLNNSIALMGVYDGHTHAIHYCGLGNLPPDNIELIHSPDCPVCVIPMGRVDDVIWLTQQEDVIFTTFGDMMRVPGSEISLIQARMRGADMRFVYSPSDALRIATDNPDKQAVLSAVGFETTAPPTAVIIKAAHWQGVENFSVPSNHVLIEPPLRAIVNGGETKIGGLISPGHTATTTSMDAFEFLLCGFNLPVAVTGFELLDVLRAIVMLLDQFVSDDVAASRSRVDSQYAHVVHPSGSTTAQKLMNRVFTLRDTFEWRSLGRIENSGPDISREHITFDAGRHFRVPRRRIPDPVICEYEFTLTGHIRSW